MANKIIDNLDNKHELIAQMCDTYGIPRDTFIYCPNTLHQSIKEALTTPISKTVTDHLNNE